VLQVPLSCKKRKKGKKEARSCIKKGARGVQESQYLDNYFFRSALVMKKIPVIVETIAAGIVLSPKICPSIIREIPSPIE
jgi:hypothetical protein